MSLLFKETACLPREIRSNIVRGIIRLVCHNPENTEKRPAKASFRARADADVRVWEGRPAVPIAIDPLLRPREKCPGNTHARLSSV